VEVLPGSFRLRRADLIAFAVGRKGGRTAKAEARNNTPLPCSAEPERADQVSGWAALAHGRETIFA
jgi:hypothetical protein